VHVSLALQRLRERLPPMIEMALYRATQDVIDVAAGQGRASTVVIRLTLNAGQLDYTLLDNGQPAAGEGLRSARQRIEVTGGTLAMQPGRSSGTEVSIQYQFQPVVELTARELQIIRLVAQGMSNREMAAALRLSARTIKFHLDNIYSRLNVNTRTQAAIYALRHGLIPRTPD
jgi:DNA-binding NarL/FixJ family response regulator